MNYLLIPFFALIIAILQRHLTQSASCKRIRENNLVMWNITLLFSLLGAIISYQIYRYELTAPLSMGQVMILTLYLLLTLLFVAVSPSGFRRLFLKRTYSEEELLYAEYHFNHSLKMLRSFFLSLLLIVPIFFFGYKCLPDNLPSPVQLEEAYLIGGLYFASFCILCPISLRQSIFWMRQLQQMPEEYEMHLLQEEEQMTRYYTRNRRI
ncbi:MAG: hypothetical protein IJ324_11550 [Lachnospiraceae bacterium]|nr:hypothetical protein [Lachnospiraceae bacterium]